MKRWRMALGVTLALALALVVASCGSSGGGGGGGGGATGTPQKGGVLNVAWQGEPSGLDPAIQYEVKSMSMENAMYDTLIKYAPAAGEAGTKFVPDLATEVPTDQNGGLSADGLTYTFHLRTDAKFAPPVNRPVTAADWKWSVERMMRLPKAPALWMYEGIVGAKAYDAANSKATEITGIKVVDPQTLTITLTQPDPTFLFKIAMNFTDVLDKATVEKWGNQYPHHPLGTGPFMFSKWTPGQSIVITRNPNYWDPAKVWLDGVTFKFGANPATALLQLQSGTIDLLGDGVPAADYVRVKNDPKWSKNLVGAPVIAWYYVFMNTKIKPFDNLKVRQAVNYAVNSVKLKKLLAGQGTPLNQVFPNGMPGYDANAQFYTYDPTKAKQLLAEAGFPNGFKTVFYTHNVDPFPRITQSIQNDLAQVGIQASIKVMDQSSYWTLTMTMGNQIPIGLSDWYMDYPDPSDWIGPLLSKAQATMDGGQNASWWWDPKVESLFAESQKTTDQTKRVALFQEMQKIIMDQAPIAPLYQPVFNTMVSDAVGGFYIHPIWQLEYQDYWKK
jgi:ABC-type transport system substrate-binding protein